MYTNDNRIYDEHYFLISKYRDVFSKGEICIQLSTKGWNIRLYWNQNRHRSEIKYNKVSCPTSFGHRFSANDTSIVFGTINISRKRNKEISSSYTHTMKINESNKTCKPIVESF